jgi:hypothetical protein
MKGDFSRTTYDPFKQYSRVLYQMGRVQLDADYNEQSEILTELLRGLARDLIGPHGGPAGELGFAIETRATAGELNNLAIGPGRYYVDGIACQNLPRPACAPAGDKGYGQKGKGSAATEGLTYFDQPNYPRDPDEHVADLDLPFLVYLDVWERYVSAIQDPDIREVALGGPDTAGRAQVVWQVKTWHLPAGLAPDCQKLWDRFQEDMDIGHFYQPGCLRPRTLDGGKSTDACLIPPEARYRGPENHLYRVEIDRVDPAAGTLAFKWSAYNGSVEVPVLHAGGAIVSVAYLGRDDRFRLEKGDWVEIVDDDYALVEQPGQRLFKIGHVDPDSRQVTLESNLPPRFDGDPARHPLLRGWDQKDTEKQKLVDGAVEVDLKAGGWYDLEYGVQVQFSPEGAYRPGDYWQIPARRATGDILWPYDWLEEKKEKRFHALPPLGVHHHYAPLAIVTGYNERTDCRCRFEALACRPTDKG